MHAWEILIFSCILNATLGVHSATGKIINLCKYCSNCAMVNFIGVWDALALFVYPLVLMFA